MAYIGFLLIMTGLAAAGGAIDKGDSLIGAVAMTAAGAVLMWLYREEDEDGEKEGDGAASCGSCPVDKPAGKGTGGHAADPQRGGGRDISGPDDGILPREDHGDRQETAAGDLRGAGGMDRQDSIGLGVQ